MTSAKIKTEGTKFDEKLIRKVADMNEKEMATFIKIAKAERKKKKEEVKQNFSITAGKIVLKFMKDIEDDKFPENFKKEILAIRDKILTAKI